MTTDAPTLRLYNTLTGTQEDFVPLEAGKVRMYVCGPTVYDDAHLGHARCYITWDVLYRFLKFLGYDVSYARNVTDVDDKILKRADELGLSPHEVARKNYESFTADMAALNCLPPDKEPFATKHIPQMIAAIQALIDQNAAYVTPEGTVYYRVDSKKDYGKLSKKPLDDLRAGARVEVDAHKENPLDFALWKHVSTEEQQKPDHAYEAQFRLKDGTSKKIMGRPGWHIECSAMNHAIFGNQIDIHAGGADLIFPHHENEIAQSESWTGSVPFAKYWLHNGFVNVSGEKMSKSLGNFSTVKKVLERYDANTIRYFLLTNHYRMPVDFNETALNSAKDRIIRIRRRLSSLKEKDLFFYNTDIKIDEALKKYPDFLEYTHILYKDLNTPQTLRFLSDLLKRGDLEKSALLLSQLGFNLKELLGKNLVFTISPKSTAEVVLSLPVLSVQTTDLEELRSKLEVRKEAKASKDWATSDAIRKELTDAGYEVMDNKDGTMAVAKDGIEIVRV